ncbi:DUF1761 domain-containing protein [Nocardia sp. NEAU-G5]|uniref:DUF1761 domain-containing protein n=1 Tax=Nocardia albiluteola TaxID=2842303 RepID=A0ABS6AUM2_9NOCA|nr:DUF1761 domain-containing protein [Nocardia albiluteola]MBU3061728.1 DUF1761 domain-containing protein [Nocardia albiluteola]
MLVVGIAVAALAAFVASSVYYAVVTPLERRVLGAAALDRGGRPAPWKVACELLRTVVVAGMFHWVASRSGMQSVSGGLVLAVVLWIGLPVILLTGSIMWERVAPVTAGMHAGDWLLKLALLGVILGLVH